MSRTPTKIGKYQIQEKIAEGGMGAVFKGTHPTLEKPVVLKKLTFSNNDHLIERFRREAKIMMEFSNENIVRVYDHFKNASAYYIVQELVDGKSVDLLLKKERYLRYDEALYIFYHACKALDYAHKNQVVHRDIKPANILLSKSGEIKLVDFGIAQSEEEDDSLTKEGMALGTPSYMAPEQYDDSRTVTFKADIYSLGIMLYEMVTGKKPFPGKMTPETLLKIQKGKYTAVRKANPALPRSIDWFIRKTIQSNPKKRAESVSMILKKLEKWYRNSDIDGIREDLICLVNDKERRPGGTARNKSFRKWLLIPLIALPALGLGGYWLYSQGFHYRTVLAESYGGFKLQTEITSPEYHADEYHFETAVFPDEEGRIGDSRLATFRYGVAEVKEDGTFLVQSEPRFLPGGAYWIKTTHATRVYWQNIFIKPFSSKGILLEPGTGQTIFLDLPAAKAEELNVTMNVRSRSDGRDLNNAAALEVEVAREFIPYNDIKQPLMTGRAYNFRVSAEGYYPLTYDLGLRKHQNELHLETRLIPFEGYLRLKSSASLADENIRILINGKPSVPSGGIVSQMMETSLLLNLKPIPLTPGDYELEIKKGRISTTVPVTIKSEEESVLLIELKKENDKTSEILVEE
ncbi:MAG: serine/threonine-protein kinase [Spirochaetales bacterium]|nr:serine/threonine-protein kinase [Spirochaetales bacterium]